jgi:hypothetical protein
VAKKFSWEVDKTSLILRIEDGDRKTEWKIRKNVDEVKLSYTLNEMLNEVLGNQPVTHEARVAAWEEQSSTAVQANTEEASRAAQAARVAQLMSTAKWYEDDDEESMFVAALPDYDAGEI